MLLPDASVCLLGMINAWETVMVLLVAFILFVSRPGTGFISGLKSDIDALFRGFRKGTDQFYKVTREDEDLAAYFDSVILFLAQGFGTGLIPKAPGTFGSIVGVAVFLLMSGIEWFWLYALVSLILAAYSIVVCGFAERILNQHDPGSVVFDEIVAMPVCFLGWVGWATWDQGGMPGQQYFLDRWPVILAGFALFRLLDVTKPGPIGRIQNLPGGLGVTADDILAAVGVNLLLLPFFHWW